MKQNLMVLILWLVVLYSQAVTIYENMDEDFSVEKPFSPSYLSCEERKKNATDAIKGLGRTIPEVIELTEIEDMFAAHGKQSVWNVYKIREDVKGDEVNLTHCSTCSFHSVKCVEVPNAFENLCSRMSAYKPLEKGAVCEQYIVSFKLSSELFQEDRVMEKRVRAIFEEPPTAINFPIAGSRNKRSIRGSRLMHHCPMPHPMTTASVKCKAHPQFVKCTQRCSFGYTLDDGIVKNMQCNYSDGVWKPTGFKECKPFVDCTMVLTSGGRIDCRLMSVTKRPQCQVECLAFEDKEAVPPQDYTCSIDGTWYPPLPFCAHPGSGLALVNAPSVRLHEDVEQQK